MKREYDYRNRVVAVEVNKPAGGLGMKLEYAYDPFNRQVQERRLRNGSTKQYDRVWSMQQMIEEYEDGELARSLIYGRSPREVVRSIQHKPTAPRMPTAPARTETSTGPVCPTCGLVNRPGSNFCAKDRTPLTPPPTQPATPVLERSRERPRVEKTRPQPAEPSPRFEFCPSCGKKLIAGESFCKYCGTQLTL